MTKEKLRYGPLRVGIGGPVGAGKTSMTEALCRALSDEMSLAVITNDIYTSEDADYLIRAQALSSDRIRGVETGGCPHTAIREDASVNLAAIEDLKQRFPKLDLILLESGGDNLAATFSPELVDVADRHFGVAHQHKVSTVKSFSHEAAMKFIKEIQRDTEIPLASGGLNGSSRISASDMSSSIASSTKSSAKKRTRTRRDSSSP